ncbi:MAG: hypothetical protein Kow00104_04380 [Rhodothalassiaceae bacterium]
MKVAAPTARWPGQCGNAPTRIANGNRARPMRAIAFGIVLLLKSLIAAIRSKTIKMLEKIPCIMPDPFPVY